MVNVRGCDFFKNESFLMVSKSIVSIALSVTVVLTNGVCQAMVNPNFDLVNSYSKVPVYYKIDNEPTWQKLKGHVSKNVLAHYLALTLSATMDDTHPTYFVFAPEPVEVAVPDSKHPLHCYIQVNVCTPLKDIRIVPQNIVPDSQKAKNITPDLIRQFKELAIARRATNCDEQVPAQVSVPSIAKVSPAPTFYTQASMIQQFDVLSRSIVSIQQRLEREFAAYGSDKISDATVSDDASHARNAGSTEAPQVQTEEWQCSVCLGNVQGQERTALSCGHTFHVACIAEWKAKNPTCPICRTPTN